MSFRSNIFGQRKKGGGSIIEPENLTLLQSLNLSNLIGTGAGSGGFDFNSDFTRLFVATNAASSYVYQVEVAGKNDISSGIYNGLRYSVPAYNLELKVGKNDDFFYSGRADIRQYTLDVLDVTTSIYTGKHYDIGGVGFGVCFSENEDKAFFIDDTNDRFSEFNLTTEGDISTAVFVQSLPSSGEGSIRQISMEFYNGGLNFITADAYNGSPLRQYTGTIPYDLSTFIFDKVLMTGGGKVIINESERLLYNCTSAGILSQYSY